MITNPAVEFERAFEARATQEAARRDFKRIGARILLYSVLTVLGIGMIFPFIWMVVTAFKLPQDLYSLNLIPNPATFDNYRTVFNDTEYPRWFLNSLIIAAIT